MAKSQPNGWSVTLALSVLAAAAVVGSLAAYGTGEPGLRAGIRATARLGVVILCVTFAASSLNALFRTAWSKWLLRNRRYIGLGFAAMHLSHAGLILALMLGHSASFWRTTSIVSVVGGGVGYVWLLAMIITSFDSTAAAIGRKAWVALHKSGMYVLWGIFVFSYLGRAFMHPLYAVLVALLAAAYGVRVAAFFKRRAAKVIERPA